MSVNQYIERQAVLNKRLDVIKAKLSLEDADELNSIIDGLEEVSYEAGYSQSASSARGDYRE